MTALGKGYKMISSLNIENFRGLEKISLTDLSPVNIIVGPNASGKTAFLEAIFLGCRAGPQAALSLWQDRARNNIVPGGPAGFTSIWSGFFSNQDLKKEINISYIDSNVGRRALKIHADYSQTAVAVKGGNLGLSPLTAVGNEVTSIAFDRVTNRGGNAEKFRVYLGPQGHIMYDTPPFIGPSTAIFSALTPSNENDNVTWLSQLSLENREGEALDLLRSEFPRIESLDVLSPSGVQGIFVSYRGNRNKLPIGLVFSGIQKVLTIILSALILRNAVILIDELENGIFYRRYSDVWKLIHKLAVDRGNQVFITSHSLECLQGSMDIVQSKPADFSLIRMESTIKGTITRKFSGSDFADAIKQDIDPRGRESVL